MAGAEWTEEMVQAHQAKVASWKNRKPAVVELPVPAVLAASATTAQLVGKIPKFNPRFRQPTRGMNKTEAKYSKHLDAQKAMGRSTSLAV
ncbi:MAG: hypothetical protein AB9866_21435 [Syntrophobacteraceae bacterium]